MLDLDYGSDSDSESGPSPKPAVTAAQPHQKDPTNSKRPKDPRPAGTPEPKSKGLNLPEPKTKKSGSKKVILELPKLSKVDDGDDLEPERPSLKRPRLEDGKNGRSSLLSMLPAPKKTAMELPAPQRVLGGGRPGVVYSAATRATVEDVETNGNEDDAREEDEVPLEEQSSVSLLPPSLAKGKGKATREAMSSSVAKPSGTTSEAVDFFSIGSASSSKLVSTSAILDTPRPEVVSAAPSVEEYRPPSPTIQDPYPGYYQMPSGQWAMYDPEYYKIYSDRWAKEYAAQIRAYERGVGGDEKGFEGADADKMVDVDAQAQRDAAAKEREEKKAITKGAARESQLKAPNMKINPEKQSGLAKTRHQLSTLLTEAYTNREALEERIAQGRRNRKEAGNKYGF
ncbi:hypothetical protein BD410DRAFT_744397 [Rickenella mellea]|uniref:Mitotic checkpoint regulator, MAD2B-interacting-domain-containing protein n=1 Tax=Rickenella mellea TaxID=50990 RepID=A0A4Y7QBF6_9AGAM|nr:hypothetical protein BD410DRAFT_744397 [Rickenella mellea]